MWVVWVIRIGDSMWESSGQSALFDSIDSTWYHGLVPPATLF